jgi:tetratricopeptide (TPR) repeat protein
MRFFSSLHEIFPRAAALTALLLFFCSVASSQNQLPQALIREGQKALDAGDFARAAGDFERARQFAPESLEVNRGLLLSYLQGGRIADAESVGQAAVARWPKDAQLQHWLGLVYFKKAQNSTALAWLQRSESSDGTQYDVHFDTALVLLSDANYSQAASELEKATKLDPKAALAHVLLGRAYQNTNRTVQAIEQFQIALRLEPAVPLGHYHLGFAYASLGRNRDAIGEYEKELPHSPSSPEVFYQLGHCQLEAGDGRSAIEHLQRAAELDPKNPDAPYDLGKAFLLQGDTAGAVLWLRRAVELGPANPSPHYQLARALEKIGKKEEAEQELATFIALKKTQPATGGMATGAIP